MQYIVVSSIHTTPDIVFPAVFRSSRAQRLAKQRKKARFLGLFRQTGSRKIASWPRRPYSQISQIKNRQFVCANLRQSASSADSLRMAKRLCTSYFSIVKISPRRH